MCQLCEKEGVTRGAQQLDHIIPVWQRPDFFWEWDNWQGLGTSCDKDPGRDEKYDAGHAGWRYRAIDDGRLGTGRVMAAGQIGKRHDNQSYALTGTPIRYALPPGTPIPNIKRIAEKVTRCEIVAGPLVRAAAPRHVSLLLSVPLPSA